MWIKVREKLAGQLEHAQQTYSRGLSALSAGVGMLLVLR